MRRRPFVKSNSTNTRITMFKGNSNYVDNNCLRCGKTVYPTDKIGK